MNKIIIKMVKKIWNNGILKNWIVGIMENWIYILFYFFNLLGK